MFTCIWDRHNKNKQQIRNVNHFQYTLQISDSIHSNCMAMHNANEWYTTYNPIQLGIKYMNESCKSTWTKYKRTLLHECSTTVNYSHVSHIIKIVNPLDTLFYAFSRLKLSEIFAFCVNLSAAQIPKNQTQNLADSPLFFSILSIFAYVIWRFCRALFFYSLFFLLLFYQWIWMPLNAYECMNINRKLVFCVRIYDILSYVYLVFIVFECSVLNARIGWHYFSNFQL